MRLVLYYTTEKYPKISKQFMVNPTLDGGGHPVPPPVFFGSGAFQIDPRDPRLMDN